jgi:TfoX/Sxy family transcriptional regulator of competence genes
MSTELAWLKERLESAIGTLPGVTGKRLFGCDGFFRDDVIFAMVWKEGRIALKFRDAESLATLQKTKGADAWSPGGKMVVQSWILVPEAWNEDEDALRPWVVRAHAESKQAPAKKKAAPKKKSAKKN